MEDDQQFCLRWNNHQSTLISVFDTLLENQTLVDCTLAAEGKFLKAHKVVLSACSPFFATLLQQQYDKHPIFILKDVKYQELRAMMDYMYRGEVNISQDQLAALLKAAESLQIKGLSDNRSGNTQKPEQHRGLNVPGSGNGGKLSGYTLEQTQTKRPRVGPSAMETTDLSGSREGSSSPSRRRRKVRRRSVENAMPDIHDNSNSSQINQSSLLPQQPQQQLQQPQPTASLTGIGAITAATSSLPAPVSALPTGSSAVLAATSSIVNTQGTTQQMTPSITKKTESVKGISDAINTENVQAVGAPGAVDEQNLEHAKGDKSNHKQKSSTIGIAAKETADMVIEPKSEYDEEGNEETVEDLTLDDEEMGMEDLDQNAGTSQAGEGSSQGYAPWQHDRSQDELLLAPQEAQQRDPQDFRALYNIATAAAAVVAAASATNDNSKVATILNEQHNCINNDHIDNNPNNIQSNSMLSRMTLDDQSYTIGGTLPTTSTPIPTPTSISIPPSTVANMLCDVIEPEISIRTMYKCCRNRFMQQQQQQHLQIMQPNSMTNTVTPTTTTANTISSTPSPPPPTTTITIGTSASSILADGSSIPPNELSKTTTKQHSNCSGCQISAAASIQLANLIGSSMLLPQSTISATSIIQDNPSKTTGTTAKFSTDHSTCKKITNINMERITVGSAANIVMENTNSSRKHAISTSSKLSPHSMVTAKKATVQFHCEFCAFSCSWKYDLKLHMRQKHGIHNKKM